jgi:hypothetical protein
LSIALREINNDLLTVEDIDASEVNPEGTAPKAAQGTGA